MPPPLLICRKATLAAAFALALAAPAGAVNWEGHQDWFLNDAPFKAFTADLPPPLYKPKPRCAEMERAHAAEPAEQVPLPGINCVKG